ncbi:MAG: hypothetical protein R3C11_27890 [Planctomycetaceae bacterium]
MPQSPLRFLHADQLNLDVPLEGISAISSSSLQELSTAPLNLLDNLLEYAMEESVPFVLLTGTLFGADPPSLAAQSALRQFAAELYELGVELVLAPHPLERQLLSRQYWDELEAILLEPNLSASIELESSSSHAHAHLHVEIQLRKEGSNGYAASDPSRENEFRIVVLEADEPFSGLQSLLQAHTAGSEISEAACGHALEQVIESTHRTIDADYVALTGYGYRAQKKRDSHQHSRFYHAAGCLMPRTFEEAQVEKVGQATLVRVEPGQGIHLTSRRVAPLRLVPVSIQVHPADSKRDLERRLQEEIDALEPAAVEKLFIIEWNINGAGDLLFELADTELRRDLEKKLKGSRPLIHQWKLWPDRNALEHAYSQEPLASQFLEQLQQYAETNPGNLVSDFLSRLEIDSQWQHRLRQLGTELSTESILAAACQQGGAYFVSTEEGVER